MLLAIYFDDQTLFNNLWAYKVSVTTAAGKASNLMPWIISSGGTVVDSNSASDADFDIAFALLMADIQWGSGGTYNYATLATTEIGRIRSYDISATDYHIKPGDNWDDWSYPSYYFPAYLREFAKFDAGNAATWNAAIAKCYNNIATNRNATSGLVGEICNSDGSRRTDNPCSGGCSGTEYAYNSCRVPFRYAMDYLWWGAAVTNPSSTETSLFASFFSGISASSIVDGYYIANNSTQGQYNNAAFVGPAGCSLMYSTTTSTQLQSYYDRTRSFLITDSYYNGTLELLTLLLMTGNFQDLREIGAPVPTYTPAPAPSTQLLDDFEDFMPYYNTQNNWGGFWYTWANAATLGATVYPIQGGFVTMTAGGSNATSTTPPYTAPATTWYLQVTGTKAAAVAPNYPSVGIGTDLVYNAVAVSGCVNVMPFTGIVFDAKGDGATLYSVALNEMNSSTLQSDSGYYQYTFTPPATWTHYQLSFATDFTQPSWAVVVPIATVTSHLQKLQWQNGDNTKITFNLSLDNVAFYPYLWSPTPSPMPSATLTSTITQTPTLTPTFACQLALGNLDNDTTINSWGGSWYSYNDSASSGTSVGYMSVTAPGANLTAYAAQLTGVVTTAYTYGFIGMGTNTSSVATGSVNCSGFTGITFWAKGDGNIYSCQLVPSATINDGNDHYSASFVAPTTWTQYQLFFTGTTPSFKQAGTGTAVTMASVLTNLNAIHWQTIGQPWSTVLLQIDQVSMFPCTVWTSTPSPSLTPTITPTKTPSPTFTGTALPSSTYTPTYTGTSTRTATPTATSTGTPLPSNTYTSTATPTATATFTGTAKDTSTPTFTPTYTATKTDTSTSTYTATATPSYTVSPTFSVTPTNTEYAGSPTDSPTDTQTYTRTPTYTPTVTLTSSYTSTRTYTVTITDTNTPGNSPTSTYTATPGNSPTSTFTIVIPSATSTYTDTQTIPTATVTYTSTTGIPTATNTPNGGLTCLFDDVEDGNNSNDYGGYWYTYASGDPAYPTDTWIAPAQGAYCSPTAGGAITTGYSMRITGTVGATDAATGYYPCLGIGSQLNSTAGSPNFTSTDLSSCTGISFYAKGNNQSYLIKIPYESDTTGKTLTGSDDYHVLFTPTAAWTQYKFDFTTFAQFLWSPTDAVPLATVLQHAKEIQWQTNFNGATGAPAAVDLSVDDIYIYGCPSCPVVATATAIVATNTPAAGTPTNTPTQQANTATITASPTLTYTITPTLTSTNTYTPVPTATNSTSPSLSVSISAPSTIVEGQQLTITLKITNNGTAPLTNVGPNNYTVTDPSNSLVLVSGPSPAVTATLAIGAETDVVYIYNVTKGGSITISSAAQGTNVSANDVISPASMPFSIGAMTPTMTATPTDTVTVPVTPTFTITQTITVEPTPTMSIFKVGTPTPMPGQTPIYVIGPNPNPTPGVPTNRTIYIWVSKSIDKIEVKIYTKAGRLVRYFEDTNTYSAGPVATTMQASYFAGLARGVYYLVITATSTGGEVGKSSIEKVVIQ